MLSVIILTLDEEANLPLALASLRGLDAEIFVVDSGSVDRSRDIARAAGCHVVEHPFENYALQRNWAFDHLPIRAPWTLCLDADERLTPELVEEIEQTLARQDTRYDAYMLCKRTIFMGRWLRHGGQYPAYHLRLFRTGRGRCEARLYDQHFVVDGRVGRATTTSTSSRAISPRSSPATTGGPSSRPRRSSRAGRVRRYQARR
jgi:glycosyltransferase involved in cell wall biosynthesis